MARIVAVGLVVVAFGAIDGRAWGREITVSNAEFQSEGHTIPVERFEPKATGREKFPPIVVVHGADSLADKSWHSFYRRVARDLAERGYVTILPHYLNRTDTKFADGAEILKHFVPWSKAIADSVTYVSTLPNVDDKRIGLTGASLGASLIMTEAAFDQRIGAVVEFFGTLPEWVPGASASKKRKPTMPPVLILHGDADQLVKVEEAKKIERFFKEKKLPHVVKIYPGQGHGFQGEALDDSLKRTYEFFNQYLGR